MAASYYGESEFNEGATFHDNVKVYGELNINGNINGNLTGNVVGNLTGNVSGNIYSSGISTFAGDANIGGTLRVNSRRTINGVIRYGTGLSYVDNTNTDRPIIHIQVASRGVGGSFGSESVVVNGVTAFTCGRSWGLTVIAGSGTTVGQILHAQTYDVYANGALVTTILNDISAYNTNNNVLIINTHDEPELNAGTLRTTLRDTYGAKLATMTTAFRYAYCYAFRHGYGTLGEAHSAYWNGGTYTAVGNSTLAVCGFSFSVVL